MTGDKPQVLLPPLPQPCYTSHSWRAWSSDNLQQVGEERWAEEAGKKPHLDLSPASLADLKVYACCSGFQPGNLTWDWWAAQVVGLETFDTLLGIGLWWVIFWGRGDIYDPGLDLLPKTYSEVIHQKWHMLLLSPLTNMPRFCQKWALWVSAAPEQPIRVVLSMKFGLECFIVDIPPFKEQSPAWIVHSWK